MEQFFDSLVQLSPLALYLILFLSAYVENVLPPIPGDTVTIFGAYLVGIGRLDFALVLAATTAGSLFGFMTLYTIGYRFGREFFERKNYRFFPREKIVKTEAWFRKYGSVVILGNRFLSGIRSVISISSGVARMPWMRVGVFALISSTVWNAMLISIGYFLGVNWQTVNRLISQYNQVAGVVIVLVLLAWLVRRWLGRLRRGPRINP
jgi:membrane protein DedA with SNARE-associated domain